MKTVIQHLLEEFDNMPEYLFYTYLKVKRDELLEKEKEQCHFYFNQGVKNDYFIDYDDFIKYHFEDNYN